MTLNFVEEAQLTFNFLLGSNDAPRIAFRVALAGKQ